MKSKAERIKWLEDCKQFCKNDEQAISAFEYVKIINTLKRIGGK